MNNSGRSGKKGFILGITLVATLGGLLFGYDTAVVSGAVNSLESVFVTPLENNPELALSVAVQFNILKSFSFLIITLLICSFMYKMFVRKKASTYSLLLLGIVVLFCIVFFWTNDAVVSENTLNAINGFNVGSAILGCVIGGSVGGFISRKLGRKKGLTLSAILFAISAIGSSMPDILNFMGPNAVWTSFVFYRLIGGIGVGLASMLSPMYIAEIAPANIRGKLVSLNQFAIVTGILLVFVVNRTIAAGGDTEWLNTLGWRYMFASEIIPAVLFLVFLLFIPETPRYMVLQGNEKGALNLLGKLNGVEKAKQILGDIKESLHQKDVPWLSFGWAVLLIGIVLSVFQQFVGINVVMYYAPKIFGNIGSGTDTALLQTILVGIVNVTFTVLAIFTVDKFGRKPLMIIGALGMAVSMLVLGTSFFMEAEGLISIVAMLTYIAGFAMSWGPVCWVLLSEIFPNSIRGAMSMAVAAQWIANLAVSWTFPMMNDNTWLTSIFHHGFSYWIYGLMGILAAIFIYKVVPETKGKTLEEMQKLWKK